MIKITISSQYNPDNATTVKFYGCCDMSVRSSFPTDKYNLSPGRYCFTDDKTLIIGVKSHLQDKIASNKDTAKLANITDSLSAIQKPKKIFSKECFIALEQAVNTHKIEKICVFVSESCLEDFLIGFNRFFSSFNKYKTFSKKECCLKEMYIFVAHKTNLSDNLIKEYNLIQKSINFSNDLINEPANVCTTKFMLDQVKQLSATSSFCTFSYLNNEQIKDLGMGCFNAVGQGSEQDNYLALLEYKNGGSSDPIVFVGKGLVFDTGGLDIKTNNHMRFMHSDMSGSAVLCGLMQAIIGLELKVNVVIALGLAENAVGPKSYRPGDILKSYKGTYVETVDTDAEGRLVLCDVLSYVQQKFNPNILIDLATLTGLSTYFLGYECAGLFANNQKLANDIINSAAKIQSLIWQFPLLSNLRSDLDSKVADISNVSGTCRAKGCIHAALFLEHFISDKTNWAHLDIAGLDDRGLACIDSLIYTFINYLKSKQA